MKLSKLELLFFLLFNAQLRKLTRRVNKGTAEEALKYIDEYGENIFSFVSDNTISFLMGKYLSKVEQVYLTELHKEIPFELSLASKVREAIDKNFPDNKTISARIWENVEDTKQLLKAEVTRAINTGENLKTASKNFADITGNSYYNTRRIIRTEVIATRNRAALDSYAAAGIKQVVVMENQSGACDICSPKDGKVVNMVDATIGITIPPFHPHCRGAIKAKV